MARGVSQFNRYSYANNSPTTFIDPDGSQSERAWDIKNGNFRGTEALTYKCTGICASVANILKNNASLIADSFQKRTLKTCLIVSIMKDIAHRCCYLGI